MLHTLSKESVEISCGTRPIALRAARHSLRMSWPSATTLPTVALTMPQTMLISVVLPAPFGPEQGEDLAGADLQVDVVQCDETRLVGLAEALDVDDRLHVHIVVQPGEMMFDAGAGHGHITLPGRRAGR